MGDKGLCGTYPGEDDRDGEAGGEDPDKTDGQPAVDSSAEKLGPDRVDHNEVSIQEKQAHNLSTKLLNSH